MTNHHKFLFEEGQWVGEGKISFSATPSFLKFYTRWVIQHERQEPERSTIRCTQQIEMQGDQDQISNQFIISTINDQSFNVELQNELIGYVSGTGIIDPQKIAWEFRGHPNFEGFEVYELQENGDYMFHAEYSSPDQFRSTIDGRIWEKKSS